jgi:hypothetical protein
VSQENPEKNPMPPPQPPVPGHEDLPKHEELPPGQRTIERPDPTSPPPDYTPKGPTP